MKITLLNKRTPLMDLDIDAQTSYVKEILKIWNPEYMPIGVYSSDTDLLKSNFTNWWRDRAIPMTRKLIKEKLRELRMYDMAELVNQSFGLSLSDQYWIKPIGVDIRWDDINYFQNPFTSDLGRYFSGELDIDDTNELIKTQSPDITTDGDVQKRWIIEDGVRYLVKNGATTFQQEPFNEAIASALLEHFSVPYVQYSLIHQNHSVYSKCPCFVDTNHEYVTAYNLCRDFAKPGIKLEDTLRAGVDFYEVPDVQPFVDQLICLDYIIMNEDRHWSNFGFVRNVETLKFEGPAPIFDNGNSLWYKIPDYIPEHYDHSLLFRKKHEKEIKLVGAMPDIDFIGLKKIPEQAESLLQTAPHISKRRAHMIATHLSNRICLLENKWSKNNPERSPR